MHFDKKTLEDVPTSTSLLYLWALCLHSPILCSSHHYIKDLRPARNITLRRSSNYHPNLSGSRHGQMECARRRIVACSERGQSAGQAYAQLLPLSISPIYIAQSVSCFCEPPCRLPTLPSTLRTLEEWQSYTFLKRQPTRNAYIFDIGKSYAEDEG